MAHCLTGQGALPALIVLVALCILVRPGPVEAQPTPTALFDADMTPFAGSAVIDFTGTVLGHLEDTLLPSRLFDERSTLRRSAGASYRFGKLFLLDVPQEAWLFVVNHEVFGHGARLRELFDGPITYQIGVPPPYGSVGGSTSFTFDRRPEVEELLSITIGGMEANNVNASRIALRAIARGKASYREMLRYFFARLDTTAYILRTDDEPEDEGHDVSDFIVLLRRIAGSDLTPDELRHRAVIGMADPLLAYSVFGLAWSYVWRGEAEGPVPAIPVGRYRYLPALRLQLTPYGTEWVVDNTFVRDAHATRVALRFGEAPGERGFGVSLHRDALWMSRRARIDADVHAWHQPRIQDDGSIEDVNGVAALATVSAPLHAKWMRWASVVVQGGYKMQGFIEGEPLGSGFMLRAGVGIQ